MCVRHFISTLCALSHLIYKTTYEVDVIIIVITTLQMRKLGLRKVESQPEPYYWQLTSEACIPPKNQTKLKFRKIVGLFVPLFSQTCFYCFDVLHPNGCLMVSDFTPVPQHQARESLRPRQRQGSVSGTVRSGFQKRRVSACHLEYSDVQR